MDENLISNILIRMVPILKFIFAPLPNGFNNTMFGLRIQASFWGQEYTKQVKHSTDLILLHVQ